MSTSIPCTRLVLLLALLALPAAASAQQITREPSAPPTLTRQYMLLKGRLTVDFWNARLSEYRKQIDAMLSAPDLLQVNELRARTGLLLDLVHRSNEKDRAREKQAEWATRIDTALMVAAAADNGYEYGEASDTMTTGYSDIDYAAMEREAEQERQRAAAEQHRNDVRRLELVLGGDEATIASLVERSEFRDRGDDESGLEFFTYEGMPELRAIANWIARNYRSDMDALAARFLADFESYHVALRQETARFVAANRAAIIQDDDVIEGIMENLRPDRNLLSITGTGVNARAARSYVEAALLLYNGQDMRELMSTQQLPIFSSIGEQLPAAASVSQNSPNPATARTVIPYTLTEHVTGVLVEVLDTKGTVVATFDQGSREPGEHLADIDVTTLPGGTYLYQLRISTATGDRLYSRSMTVDK